MVLQVPARQIPLRWASTALPCHAGQGTLPIYDSLYMLLALHKASPYPGHLLAWRATQPPPNMFHTQLLISLHSLAFYHLLFHTHPQVLTVDKYQGRDKGCILVSWVRSNSSRAAGQLLCDWQRLNVALTRAKHKLVMVGSPATLSSVPLLAQLVEMAASNGWMVNPCG